MSDASGRDATILVVDDEESLTEMVSAALRFADMRLRQPATGSRPCAP